MMQRNEDAVQARRCVEWPCRYEVRAEHFLRAIPDLLFLIDRDGKYLDFQPGKEIQPYVPPEEFLGRQVLEILPESVGIPCQYLITRALATRQIQSFVYQLVVDGVPHKYEARIVPNQPDNILALVRDITALDPPLTADKSSFRVIFENSLDAMAVVYQSIIVSVNKALTELFGYSHSNSLLGRYVLDLIVEEDRFNAQRLMRRHASDNPAPSTWRTHGLRRDGSTFALAVAEAEYRENGRKYSVTSFRDVSYRRQAVASASGLLGAKTRLRAPENNTADTQQLEIFASPGRRPVQTPFGQVLTPREVQVLSLIAIGHSTKEVAAILDIAYKTADAHRTHLMEKLGVHETASIVRFAIRSGLIEP